MEVQFPFNGLHEGMSAEKQPPTTTAHAQNVRPFDQYGERIGGPRPGLQKAYTTQVGGEHPILLIASITTTYIESA